MTDVKMMLMVMAQPLMVSCSPAEAAHARPLIHCNATLCTFRSEKHHGSRLTAALQEILTT